MYADVFDLSVDNDLRGRIVACAATLGVPNAWGEVDFRMWEFAAQPGWGDQYGAATGDDKGRRDDVISDEWILAAVLVVMDALIPKEPEPEPEVVPDPETEGVVDSQAEEV